MEKRYYLAYGSNLNVRQMRSRCPEARIVGTAVIPDYRLMFKGSQSGCYLTIEPALGHSVPVGVWEVSEWDEACLDIYEGYPRFYYKKELRLPITGIRSGKVRTRTAFVYIMQEDRHLGLPTAQYLQTCLIGYTDFKFDIATLFKAYDYTRMGVQVVKGSTHARTCPLCGCTYFGYPALSREDNQTLICPDCGTRQALDSLGLSKGEQDEILAAIHSCGQ